MLCLSFIFSPSMKQNVVEGPQGCPSSTLSACMCPTAYSWCPFNLFFRPYRSNFLNLPLGYCTPHILFIKLEAVLCKIYLDYPPTEVERSKSHRGPRGVQWKSSTSTGGRGACVNFFFSCNSRYFCAPDLVPLDANVDAPSCLALVISQAIIFKWTLTVLRNEDKEESDESWVDR